MTYRKNYWSIDVRHEDLGKFRHIQGEDKDVVEQKARMQMAIWDDQWQRKLEVNRRKQEVTQRLHTKQSRISEAETLTSEARSAIEKIESLLHHTLGVNDEIDWNALKNHKKFREALPPKESIPAKPDRTGSKYRIGKLPTLDGILPIPSEPYSKDLRFIPQLSFWKSLFTSQSTKLQMATLAWREAHNLWTLEMARINSHNDPLLQQQMELAQTKMDEKFQADLVIWEKKKSETEKRNSESSIEYDKRKKAFFAQQKATNAAIDAQRDRYLSGEVGSIIDYCDMVLANSQYPDNFPREWEIDYNVESKMLLVDYRLPSPECIPTLKEVKYQSTKGDMKESFLSEKESNALFDSALYQVTLRTLHELFEADRVSALDAIVFNGYVRALEKASGNHVTACVLSVQASKEEFLAFNLQNVDPKSCFKALKGVGSAKLHGITPVPPIARIDKIDSRFIDSPEQAIAVDETTNLAAMDWEDFEHLIREIFEKEFAAGGGEVRVTQASRDGGVDAVIFDPDPIRGGKIVVQAKRYTNTVGVSAVRDLYGTMMNEGAMKGILVTTSSYGPDAYDFVKDKPLTLLSGGNLLHLLSKHGHRARIDIVEARLTRAEQLTT
ncbi:MAG: restriction endonuclease [Pseudomonadota bacterium]